MRRLPLILATLAVRGAAMALVFGRWSSVLVGHGGCEAMSNAWVRWLVSRALAEGRLPFFHCGAVLGEDFWLYPVDLATTVPTALLQPLLGEPGTTNLAVAVLLGFGTWATGHAAESSARPPGPPRLSPPGSACTRPGWGWRPIGAWRPCSSAGWRLAWRGGGG